MIAKIRITTEEEAKAAIAERRRLAREQAEREAELERQRQVRFLTASLHVKAAALSAKRGDRLIWVNHFAGGGSPFRGREIARRGRGTAAFGGRDASFGQ